MKFLPANVPIVHLPCWIAKLLNNRMDVGRPPMYVIGQSIGFSVMLGHSIKDAGRVLHTGVLRVFVQV